MAITCTRCEGTGFLNIDQVPVKTEDNEQILAWIKNNTNHDVSVCDCCGDMEFWHGTPGAHYNDEDPQGYHGPYDYNGGLCECH